MSSFLKIRRFFTISILFVFSWQICLSYPAQAWILGGVSLKDEKEMGKRFDTMMRSSLPVIEDPEVRNYVNDVLRRLTSSIPPQPFDFKASVVLHNALNAFAVPGGYVFVFSGMIMNLANEAELAGVLSHELAHVTQRHVASRMERAQMLTLGSLLLAVAGIALGGGAGAPLAATALGASQSAMLNYSRLDESEADNIGLQYLKAAHYPLSGMVGGFKTLRQKNWMSGVRIPTYLSTHPAIGDRINNLSSRIAAMPEKDRKGELNNNRFKRVQTLLWARYGDVQAALQRFSGKDGLSLMGKGIVLSRQNRVNEAMASFSKALEADPNDPLIMRESGIFHFRKGDMRQAEKLLQSAMRKDRNDYMASFFYGRLLDETGRQKEAPAFYKDVLRHIPKDPEVHEALARSYGNSGNPLLANIHMTYSALYSNNKKQTERWLKQARVAAEKQKNMSEFKKLEKTYKEIKEIWDKS